MPVSKHKVIITLLITFLIANVFNLGFKDVILYANAQSNVITGQNIITPQGSLSTITTAANAAANVVCNTGTQAKLTISKIVQDPNNLASGTDLSTLIFTITWTDNGQTNVVTLNGPTSSQGVCITAGHGFSVSETGTPAGFTFNSQLSGTCSGTAVANQDVSCVITNTILTSTGQTNNNLIIPNVAPSSPNTSNGVQTQRLVTPQGSLLSGTAGVAGPTGSEASNVPTDKQINPPEQTCAANTVSGTVAGTTAITAEATRIPSASKLVIDGSISLDKVKAALNELGTNTVLISLFSDLKANDGLSLNLANDQFVGKVTVLSPDGAHQRVINFNVKDVRTECQFVTLAEAIKGIAPIGGLKAPTAANTKPSDNKLLIGGQTVSTVPKTDFPSVLNPVFATCQTTATGGSGNGSVGANNADNIAIYNVQGTVDINQVSGKSLDVQITSVINTADSNLVKITGKNSQFVAVNLIADGTHQSSHVVPFTLKNLFTDCKKVDQATNSIFRTLPHELNLS
jgi:hypothetical protein